MQNIYVWEPKLGLGKLECYFNSSLYPYIVKLCKENPMAFHGLFFDGKSFSNCMAYAKQEIKLLHKKPLRHFIEKRQGK